MLTRLSARELSDKLRSREVSAVEVAQAHLDRISSHNDSYFCFLSTSPERAIASAERAQSMIDEGRAVPLTGIPIALKDNMNVRGLPTTCASKILDGYVPPFDGHVAKQLDAAGAVIVGKTNLDEFAMGTSTEHSAFGPTRNPWNAELSPGGSSGGSAAAVCAEMVPLALGSDTGGSIRQPASLCGVVGFKPTYGRCSRYGLVAFGSSLDQIGPFARSVEDAAWCASAITGHDPMDSTSLEIPPIDVSGLKAGSLKGKRFGLPRELFGEGIAKGVLDCVRAAVDKICAEGAVCEEVDLPSIKYGVTTYYIIAPAEASSNLARYDGVRYGLRVDGDGHIGTTERTRAQGFGHEVKARIMIGTYALSAGYYDAYYLRAQQVRGLMQRELATAFENFDAILCPTSPVVAFKLGELTGDPMALKLLDLCTIPANMGGNPAISIPCGLSDGLPVGLQLMGPVLKDEGILQTAWCVEQVLGAAPRPPIP